MLVLAGIMSSLVALRFGAPLLLVFLVVGMLARRIRHRRREIRRRADWPIRWARMALGLILFDGGLRTQFGHLPQRARPGGSRWPPSAC